MASARVAASGLTGAYLQTAGDATNLTTYTFSSQNFGTASADRVIAVAVGGRATATRTISSVAIAGSTATQAGQGASGTFTTGHYYLLVPSGTSGNVVVQFSGAMIHAYISMWAITGGTIASTSTNHDQVITNASPVVLAPTVTGTSGGFIIANAISTNSLTTVWSNAIERYDAALENSTATSADSTAVGSTSPTATMSSSSSTGRATATAFSI